MQLRMKTPTDVRRALQKVANMVLEGTLDPKRASAITFAANAILSSIRTDEQQRKIAELEALINEIKEQR